MTALTGIVKRFLRADALSHEISGPSAIIMPFFLQTSAMTNPRPTNLTYHQKSRELEIHFDDGQEFSLSAEYLRVYSPSAEVQGHGPGQEVLQIGKENVQIEKIEPVGNYAVQLVFDDKHDSGIYSWETLYDLGANQNSLWTHYLERLKEGGHERKVN